MLILLSLHIAAGAISAVSGAIALAFRKGGNVHRRAGWVFVLAMVATGTTAGILGGDVANIFAGGISIYLVGTAWMAAHRKDGEAGWFEVVAFVVAIACGLASCAGAASFLLGLRRPANPFIVPVSFFISAAIVLAAAGDLSVVLRRGVSGAQRIARHLWRMCLGLFIAAGSFAAQGAGALPSEWPRQQLLLGVLLLVLGLMIYWLARTYRRGASRST